MDKNIIKNHLTKRFISEETTPGIAVTAKAKKESEKINKAGVKAVEKDVAEYDKSLKQENPDMSKMATNKYNYVDDAEKTYHEEMEILNGQEMIEYSSEPGAEFKKRAEEAIEGSSRMGNSIAANAEEAWGASSDDFGKNLTKRIKDSSKKRADAEIQTYGMGDVQIPTGNKVQVATTAMAAGKPKGDTTKVNQSASDKTKIKTVKENNNNPQIKESMKRIKFNKDGDKPFQGVNTTQKLGHALTLIPEGYKVDNKEFEMTDGIVTARIRWEGNLSEGKAVVLSASDKKLVNEDMSRMKALMGYKSQDTLGTVRGNARLDENKAFADIWKKSRKLLGESEEIEDADAVEGSAESLDTVVKQAPEAKKHVEGSVSTEKGTKAPAPKTGSADSIDKVVKHAPEAKKHVEGSVAVEKKTEAPTPKEGNWEEIKKSAPEAKKDIESGKSTDKATDKAKVVAPAKAIKENEELDNEPEGDEPEGEDSFYKPNADDDSAEDKEPTANDIKGEVPPAIGGEEDDATAVPAPSASPLGGLRVMKNANGEHFIIMGKKHAITDANGNGTPIPQQYVELALKNPSAALAKMEDEAEFGGEEEMDETQKPVVPKPVAPKPVAAAPGKMPFGK